MLQDALTNTDNATATSIVRDAHRDALDDEDFCDMLLAALVGIASKSKRRQADINAALRRSKLAASPERIGTALRRLEAAACIRDIVPLYDGGMLVTVTNLGMDKLGRAAQWRFLQDLSLAPT